MKVQLLVASMYQTDSSLIAKMNIQTDAVIGNQCNECSDREYLVKGRRVIYYNRQDRGVGVNRNVALLHCSEEILTFADEDMVFVDGYEDLILKAFEEIPDADAIIFNTNMPQETQNRKIANRAKRVHFFNALSYGTSRLSVRRTALKRENIMFHTCFGGGTRYSCGEDTIFITDMLKHGLHIYTYPVCIATVDSSTSSWFRGYTKKLLYDKGALYSEVSKKWVKALCVQDLLRHNYLYKECGLSFGEALKIMCDGATGYKMLLPYEEC